MRLRTRWLRAVAVAVALGAGLTGLQADVVMLENGSRLVGTVEGIAPGKVLLATDFAGTLTLDAARIVHIRTETPVNIAFTDGRRVSGTLAAEETGAVVRTAEGSLPIADMKDVKAVWAEGQPDPTLPGQVRRTWRHELAVDLGGKSGSTRTFRAGGAVKSVLTGPDDRLTLYGRAVEAEENHSTTEEEYIGGGDYEHSFWKRHLWYARFEAEADDIEGIDLRTTTAGGYGYYFIKEDTQSLRGRLGLQYRHEKYDTSDTEDVLAPEIGASYEVALRSWLKLVSEITYAPAFDDPSNYRIDHTSALDIPLNGPKRWSLRLGITHTYNSIAPPGYENLDTVYLARLVLKLP